MEEKRKHGLRSPNRSLRLCFVSALLAVVLFAACSRPSAPEPAAGPPPNVVLIVLDAFRADRIGAERNGLPLTPMLNRLTAESLEFTRAAASCSWTRPSMASLFTSLYVDAHQVFYVAGRSKEDEQTADALPDALETIAEWMKKGGYATLGIQTNANLTAELGFAQGFDEYLFENDAKADWVTDRASERLAGLKQPYFLYAHFMDSHAPYDPPEAYRTTFGPLPAISAEEQAVVDQSLPYVLDMFYHTVGALDVRKFATLSPEGRETLAIRYDAACRFMDDQLTELLARIERETPNTLVVILADHGEEFWEHGSLGHGGSLYEEQIAVPFFIHGPGIQPRQEANPVSTVHLLPTLAAYLKRPPEPNWQGQDLLKGYAPDMPVFAKRPASAPLEHLCMEMARVGTMKLIVHPATGQEELFDLAADPRETNNLAAAQPDATARMRSLLTQHLKDNRNHRQGGRSEVRLSPELREQQRRIGYGKQE
ncbi:MAG: Sulfatase protein [Candidatus Hydrogenedentes bacterium]|nr:Sulfatase protein [Candidatus Hydrogenedentota bacterium]